MTNLGLHVLLDLEGCPEELLSDVASIKTALRKAAELAGATIVGEAFHSFNPPGVSGVLLIAESHLSIHTWPTLGKATLDVYTCGEKFDAEAAADLLAQFLEADRQQRTEIPRGISTNELPVQHAQHIQHT